MVRWTVLSKNVSANCNETAYQGPIGLAASFDDKVKMAVVAA
jgi:hypothetical protein